MEAVFLKILNMGITAGYLALAVILMRLLLKKAPKWIAVLMWGLVAIRLVCPFSLESIFSLIPSAETVPSTILHTNTPSIHSGIGALNSVVNPIFTEHLAPAAGQSVTPMQQIASVASILWLAGMAAMLVYIAFSYLKIRARVKEAVPQEKGIWICDRVDTPFILGVIRPRIYLPSAMDPQDMEYVIAHEKAHLKRRDHWWKPFGFLLLTVYWFNPLLWVGYVLLCKDIELACDEKVIRDMGADSKKAYSDALINCSAPRKGIAACPLAFGEVGVKGRIKAVLHYKKPAFWLLVTAVVCCFAVALCFLTDPKDNKGSFSSTPLTPEQQQLVLWWPQYFGLDASNGLDVYVWQMAHSSYSFGLLPHTDTPRDRICEETMSLMGTTADTMHLILSTYNIDESDIHIIPWQNPLSSYIPSLWVDTTEENREAKYQEYIESIKEMLFTEPVFPSSYFPIYDSINFDVDRNGVEECCVLSYGHTSGLFTFGFTAQEPGDVTPEYRRIFCTEWYDLSFVRCGDGVVRVQGIDHQDNVHLFDISVVDGEVLLTENGQDIS